jgi:hypothetical protein
LAALDVPVAQKEGKEFERLPLIYCDGHGFCVDGACGRNRLSIFFALFDIQADSFEHAGFGGVDRIAEAVDAGEVLAVGVILTTSFSMVIG